MLFSFRFALFTFISFLDFSTSDFLAFMIEISPILCILQCMLGLSHDRHKLSKKWEVQFSGKTENQTTQKLVQ